MGAMNSARCLLVAHTVPPVIGGSAGVYAALATHAGGAIAVLSGRRDLATGGVLAGWRAADAAAGYPVHRIAWVRPPYASAWGGGRLARRLRWAGHALLLALAVARHARAYRADAVCIADDETVGWLVPFVRHVLRRRALVYCHGDDLADGSAAHVRGRARWFAQAHAVVAAGTYAAARLADPFGVPHARIVRISNGVDLARFGPLPPDPGLAASLGLSGGRVLLAPSRLVPRKGIDRTIAALPGILERQPDAVLVVVGDGPQRDALEAMARSAGVAARVRFLGAVDPARMPALYALAELVVLPNRAEPGEIDGLPLVILEAQACARPVIGGLAGGTPEAIAHEATGLLVDGDDPAAIAAAVLRVLDDSALAARLATGALEWARGQGWQGRAAKFLAACAPG